ncbi:MAG: ATP-dependent DNA helicase [Deltaproteobacteria bacterium]|nr:ATP-dependent DNA helicase [Deltaproteobacteria bacterium]
MSALAALGHLASVLPGYEVRAGQASMAAAVETAIAERRDLLVEAGTGTGKTLAYLVPALLAPQRVLVSTATRTLQTQILQNDLPAAQLACGVQRSVAVLKGRANYLCPQRIDTAMQRRRVLGAVLSPELAAIEAVARSSEGGDRAEVFGIDDGHPIWAEVTSTVDNCLGSQCPRLDSCFVARARRRAAAADVVIVNHHLLLADFAVRERWAGGGLLPGGGTIVLDEAHALADTVTNFFGAAVSERRLTNLLKDLRPAQRALGDPLLAAGLAEALDQLEQTSEHLWQALRQNRHGESLRGDRLLELQPLAAEVDDALAWTHNLCGTEEASRDPVLAKASESLWALRSDLDTCVPAGAPRPEYVRWVEQRPRDVALVARPIDVAAILQRTLLALPATRIFTSATLAVQGRFELVREQLGLAADTPAVTVPSPFDFARQALLYIPDNMPDPRDARRDTEVAKVVANLALAAGGATMALFASHQALQRAAELVPPQLPFAVLWQGQEPRERLLERFVAEQPALLLATMGFWQGVDLPAEALRVVVLDKIPFPPPDEPLMVARAERLQEAGRSPFAELWLPAASQALRQGFGRLVRSRRHTGVVAVLDPRLWTMRYGAQLRANLPPATVARDWRHVLAFLANSSSMG